MPPVTMQGTLRKRGQLVQNWKPRHFTVTQSDSRGVLSTVRYWRSEASHARFDKPLGTLRVLVLLSWRECWGHDDDGRGFVIQGDTGRFLHVRAATTESAAAWVTALRGEGAVVRSAAAVPADPTTNSTTAAPATRARRESASDRAATSSSIWDASQGAENGETAAGRAMEAYYGAGEGEGEQGEQGGGGGEGGSARTAETPADAKAKGGSSKHYGDDADDGYYDDDDDDAYVSAIATALCEEPAADEAKAGGGVRLGWLWSRGATSSQWSKGYYRLFESHFARYASDGDGGGGVGAAGAAGAARAAGAAGAAIKNTAYINAAGAAGAAGNAAAAGTELDGVQWMIGLGNLHSVHTVKNPPRLFNKQPGLFRFAVNMKQQSTETTGNVHIFAAETEAERTAWLAALHSLL